MMKKMNKIENLWLCLEKYNLYFFCWIFKFFFLVIEFEFKIIMPIGVLKYSVTLKPKKLIIF